MSAFLIALVLALLASTGGRDQLLVARLSSSFRRPMPVLVAAWVATAATSAAAAWAGSLIAPLMPPAGKSILLAITLVIGAIELAWRSFGKPVPKEPTRSIFAILVVLVAHQLGDAARFLVFAVAAGSPSALLVGIGGAIGSGAAITAGWLRGSDLVRSRVLLLLRPALAATFVIAAAVIVIHALQLV